MDLADTPGNVTLDSKSSDLNKDSVVNISQILTLDKPFLIEKVAR
jgi:mRNA interferase MazF